MNINSGRRLSANTIPNWVGTGAAPFQGPVWGFEIIIYHATSSLRNCRPVLIRKIWNLISDLLIDWSYLVRFLADYTLVILNVLFRRTESVY